MMPFFANPLFAWLLPLAALPVIFHLFFKVKKRPRPFPTLMFFHRLDPRLSARKQLKEWLILLLRTLLILLTLLALARPRWITGFGGGSVAAVMIIDNSASMQRVAGNPPTTPLRTAVEAANALLSGMEGSDTAGIVLLIDDPTVSLPNGLVSDKASLRTALNRIAETEASGRVGDALHRAFALLETSSATRFEVHIFTDLQETEWGKAAADLPAPRAGTTLAIHRIATGSPKEANVAITGIELPGRRLLAGRNLPVRVVLRNTSDADANIRLVQADDAGNQGAQEVSIPKNAEKTAVVVLNPEAAGFHWCTLAVEGDSFAGDNRAGIGYMCAEKSAVLFVGQPEQFGVLPVALSPATEGRLSGLLPEFVGPDALAKSLEDKKPLLVVVAGQTTPANLRTYVAQGGNVLLVPTAGSGETASAGKPVIIFQKNAPLFNDLRDEKGELALKNVRAFRYVALPANPEATALLGLEDGRALFTEQKVGRGHVFTSGLGFDANWSTLPLKGAFLALAQSLALTGDAGNGEVTRLVAGEALSGTTGTTPVHLRSLAGSPLDWKGLPANLPVFPRAGVYVVESDGKPRYVAVRAAEQEGRWQFITTAKVPALGTLPHSVRTYSTPDALVKEFRTVSRGMDFYLPLLLLALAMLLVEGWIANAPPRKATADTAAARKESQREVVEVGK